MVSYKKTTRTISGKKRTVLVPVRTRQEVKELRNPASSSSGSTTQTSEQTTTTSALPSQTKPSVTSTSKPVVTTGSTNAKTGMTNYKMEQRLTVGKPSEGSPASEIIKGGGSIRFSTGGGQAPQATKVTLGDKPSRIQREEKEVEVKPESFGNGIQGIRTKEGITLASTRTNINTGQKDTMLFGRNINEFPIKGTQEIFSVKPLPQPPQRKPAAGVLEARNTPNHTRSNRLNRAIQGVRNIGFNLGLKGKVKTQDYLGEKAVQLSDNYKQTKEFVITNFGKTSPVGDTNINVLGERVTQNYTKNDKLNKVIQGVHNIGYNLGLKAKVKTQNVIRDSKELAKTSYFKEGKKAVSLLGYVATEPFRGLADAGESVAEPVGEFRKKIPDTSIQSGIDYNLETGKFTDVSREYYTKQRTKSRENQGEFLKGFIPAVTSYPVKHPVKTGLLLAAPYAFAEVGAVSGIVGGRALIAGARTGLISPTGVKVAYATGKVTSLGVKAGLGYGMYKVKKQEYSMATTPKGKGAFWGGTVAEGVILYQGMDISNQLPKPATRYYFTNVRPQVDVLRAGGEYATKEAMYLAEHSGKLTREIVKADINPKSNIDYENIKLFKESKTGKRDITRFRNLPKDSITHGGTAGQGTYLDEPILKGWKGVEAKGVRTTLTDSPRVFGDADIYASGKETGIILDKVVPTYKYNTQLSGGTFSEAFGKSNSFRTGAGIPQNLVKYTDPHAYDDQFKMNPFTGEPQLTPRGEQTLPFKTQTAGKLEGTFKPYKSETFFGTPKPNEQGKVDVFYRTTKDYNDLLTQARQVMYEGKATPKLVKEYDLLTEGYKNIKDPHSSFFPNFKGDTVKFPIAEAKVPAVAATTPTTIDTITRISTGIKPASYVLPSKISLTKVKSPAKNDVPFNTRLRLSRFAHETNLRTIKGESKIGYKNSETVSDVMNVHNRFTIRMNRNSKLFDSIMDSKKPTFKLQTKSPLPTSRFSPSSSPRGINLVGSYGSHSPSKPSSFSKAISKSVSGSGGRSPSFSPSKSPSFSPSPSPSYSPSPSFSFSPSPSPSPSVSFSPSVSPSASPSPSTSPSISYSPSPQPRASAIPIFRFKPGKAKKLPQYKQKDRGYKYKPSVVAFQYNIHGKKPKKLTGLEVRPL